MLSRSEVKYIQSLCHKKQRNEEGLFLAEGPKIIQELTGAGFVIKKVYVVNDIPEDNRPGAPGGEWLKLLPQAVPIVTVTPDELKKISNLQAPNRVLAVVQQQLPKLPPVIKNKISIVLDGIQDPGNLGTIIRIADWFGLSQIICSMDTVELYNPKVIQSTMGSFVRVNVWYNNPEDFLKTVDIPVLGALLNGKSIYETEKLKEGVLVIGNESKGIRENVLKWITRPVTIPRIGGAESLNAAVAAGIIISHISS